MDMYMTSIFCSIQSNGLQKIYKRDTDFALKMRMIPAIAFVLVSIVIGYFKYLIENNDFRNEAQSV